MSVARVLDGPSLAASLPGAERDAIGIWRVGSTPSVSYPAGGNAECFALEEGSWWFRHRNRIILTLMERFKLPPGAFLDAGGGNGFVSKSLQEAGLDVVLLEPGEAGARAARERGVQTVIAATLEQAAFPQGAFAGAGLFDVLEHIENDVGVLTATARAVSRDGALFISVPACPWLFSGEDREAGHFRRYTRKSLLETIHRAELETLWCGGAFLTLRWPALLTRRVPWMLGMQRSWSSKARATAHTGAGPVQRIMQLSLERELGRISRGEELPAGLSLFAVARPRR